MHLVLREMKTVYSNFFSFSRTSMAQSQQSILDKRLDGISSLITNTINNTLNNSNIQQHKYISPIQHHQSSLILHSIVIDKNIKVFEHLFPSLVISRYSSLHFVCFITLKIYPDLTKQLIYLKKVVIFQIASECNEHQHVLDMSPFDLLNHIDKLRDIFIKFNVFKYNHLISKTLDKDDDYQQYLYSYNYIEDIIRNKKHSDYGIIATVPSNLYLNVNYKHKMILLPKYYEYNPSNQMFCDLDTKIFSTYCREHTPLFALQTLRIYLDSNIVKKYTKSILDAMYRIYGFVHAKNQQIRHRKAHKMNKDTFKPSRIWDNFLFNLHPSMIYINHNMNWSTFIQLFLQIFQSTTINIKQSHPNKEKNILMEPSNLYFTEQDLNDNKVTQLKIKIMYIGGGGNGISDHHQYLAPELLSDFVPESEGKNHYFSPKVLIQEPKINKMFSLSLHSNPMSPTEIAELQKISRGKQYASKTPDVMEKNNKSDHRTDPSPNFLYEHSNSIGPKQSVTVFSDFEFISDDLNDLGAIISDIETKQNEEDALSEDDGGYAAGGETPIFYDTFSVPLNANIPKQKIETIKKKKKLLLTKKDRTDIDYLPDLWNLSSNIFALGVMVFVLLNGYPPFETAARSDRWYKEIVRKKFHRFWKLHRASPINAIPIPSAPISFTPSTMNVLSPPIINTKFGGLGKPQFAKSRSVQKLPNFPFTPISPNTAISANAHSLTYSMMFSDHETIQSRRKQQSIINMPKPPALNQKSISSGHIYAESEREEDIQKVSTKKKNKKKEKMVYDYRSIQGFMNDMIRYDPCSRLQAFFNYNHNDIDYNNNLQAMYHKYWFLDIGYNDDEEFVDHTYNFDDILIQNEKEMVLDEKEMVFLNILDKLRYDQQEQNRKKAKTMDDDEYVSRCICFAVDMQQNDPSYYPFNVKMEGLCLCGSAELYSCREWTDIFHSIYHIIQNKCHGQVDKQYTDTLKRLICWIRIASNNNEQKEDKSIKFEISIWKSLKWKQFNTKETTIYVVQWKRLHGNWLDYIRVIHRVMHGHCASLFYLPSDIRRAMKPPKC